MAAVGQDGLRGLSANSRHSPSRWFKSANRQQGAGGIRWVTIFT